MTLKDGVQGLPKVLTTESYYNDSFFKKRRGEGGEWREGWTIL